MKTGEKQNNQTAKNFRFYRKQKGNGRKDLRSCLPLDRMKLLGSHTATEKANRKQEQEFRVAMKSGGFADLGGKSV
jgi:hypothetical protein